MPIQLKNFKRKQFYMIVLKQNDNINADSTELNEIVLQLRLP